MAVRPILILPDPALRRSCAPIEAFDADLRALAADMFETMYHAPGIGLAAPQVGVLTRLAVIDVAKKEEPPAPIAFVNPEVIWASPERAVYEEGCLSIPEYYEDVERPERVRVRYQDLEGGGHEIEADGLLAVCLQHEIDHLDGILFIDHISRLKRERVSKKFAKQARQRQET